MRKKPRGRGKEVFRTGNLLRGLPEGGGGGCGGTVNGEGGAMEKGEESQLGQKL